MQARRILAVGEFGPNRQPYVVETDTELTLQDPKDNGIVERIARKA